MPQSVNSLSLTIYISMLQNTRNTSRIPLAAFGYCPVWYCSYEGPGNPRRTAPIVMRSTAFMCPMCHRPGILDVCFLFQGLRIFCFYLCQEEVLLSFVSENTMSHNHTFLFLKKKKILLFIFRERGREGERKGEKHQCVVSSRPPHTGDLDRNPGMCPDWELNW